MAKKHTTGSRNKASNTPSSYTPVGGPGLETVVGGQHPSHLPGLLTADLCQDQIMLLQVPPDPQQPSLPIHRATPRPRHTRLRGSPFDTSLPQRSHPESRPGSLGPLASGRRLRGHLQQRYWADLMSLPKLMLRQERGVKENNTRSSNDTRKQCGNLSGRNHVPLHNANEN